MSQREVVLVIDNESQIREMICQLLSKRYEVILASNAGQAFELARERQPQVILLDVLTPGFDGFALCTLLRSDAQTKMSRILVLSSNNDPKFRVTAFDAGADDYILKPFFAEELLARVAAKMRRFKDSTVTSAEKQLGDVVLDFTQMCLREKNGIEVRLGAIELKILSVLSRSLGKVVSRKELLDTVWGGDVDKRMVDPHITSLRKKLSNSNVEIKTVYGEGYSLIVSVN